MAVQSQEKSPTTNQVWRRVVILGVALLLLYVVISQVKSLSPSISQIRHARAGYLGLGLLATIATFFVAAGMYQLLAFHRLSYHRTLLIQTASGFANRLLPAGLGGMGLIAQYLRVEKHTTAEAVTVVGTDNILGIAGHFLLFWLAVLISNVSLGQIHIPHASLLLVGIVVVIILAVALTSRLRKAVTGVLRQITHDIGNYRKQPWRVVLAACNTLLLTLLYVSILWACVYAVGIHLTFAKVLVVFTAGSIVGNATPTPGGVIGAEAGLFGGFVAYHLSDGTALAIALLYRFLTYWLPILPGLLAFWFAQRKLKLIG